LEEKSADQGRTSEQGRPIFGYIDQPMTDIYRTHVKEVYLKESRCGQPKEIYRSLSGMTESSGLLNPESAVTDKVDRCRWVRQH